MNATANSFAPVSQRPTIPAHGDPENGIASHQFVPVAAPVLCGHNLMSGFARIIACMRERHASALIVRGHSVNMYVGFASVDSRPSQSSDEGLGAGVGVDGVGAGVGPEVHVPPIDGVGVGVGTVCDGSVKLHGDEFGRHEPVTPSMYESQNPFAYLHSFPELVMEQPEHGPYVGAGAGVEGVGVGVLPPPLQMSCTELKQFAPGPK